MAFGGVGFVINLAAGTGVLKTGRLVGVGSGTVQRVEAAMGGHGADRPSGDLAAGPRPFRRTGFMTPDGRRTFFIGGENNVCVWAGGKKILRMTPMRLAECFRQRN